MPAPAQQAVRQRGRSGLPRSRLPDGRCLRVRLARGGQRRRRRRRTHGSSGGPGRIPRSTAAAGRATPRLAEHLATGAQLDWRAFERRGQRSFTFGLGRSASVDYLEVTWLDGTVSRLDRPAINQYHAID
ncbi:MAG: ASPIC/UnbV domain-containing protein [Candidatus Latescibacterota bacterium]|nr:MAG: ASPIC/UnbV domain-containing protein [Candidatus Latescibacterota bacterium]